MTTSGTIAATTFTTNKVLEHALRRCRVKPALQTPEVVQTALENLYLILVGPMATQGLNLWCVEANYIGLSEAQATYDMLPGTICVLNVIYSQPTLVSGTNTYGTNSAIAAVSSTTAVRIGVKASAITASSTLTIAYSTDGVSYTTATSETRSDWAADTYYWFRLDPPQTGTYFKVTSSAVATFDDIQVASSVMDLPVTQWSRDTFAVINDKSKQGRPSTCFYLERLLTPRVTLWPVPNNSTDHLTVYRHRQVQDIGALTEEVEVPQRWFEPLVWKLAGVLCYELDMVDPSLIPSITAMAEKVDMEVSADETDGASLQLRPGIRVYNM